MLVNTAKDNCYQTIKNFNKMIRTVLMTVALLGFIFSASSKENTTSPVTLVKDHKAILKVLVDPTILPIEKQDVVKGSSERGEEVLDPTSEQRKAIREFVQYIKEITGAELSIQGATEGAVGCYVGTTESFPWVKNDIKELGQEGFTINTDGKNIFLLGNSSFGVRHAVNTFLMQQGCRWFFPGKVWEEIPKKSTIQVTSITREKPSFDMGRTIWYGYGTYNEPAKDQAEWNYHNRMGSVAPVSIGHTGYGIDPVKDFAAHPEWFALVKGQRKASKLCYSNPEVIQRMIQYAFNEVEHGATSVSLTPADGLGYCECPLCFASSKGAPVKEEMGSFFATLPDNSVICTVSESLFKAVNQVAKAVGEKSPNVILGCYGYSAYSHPPSFKLEPNVFVQATTQYRRTPLTLEQQMNVWGQRARQVGIRGYWSVYQWDWDNPKVGKFIPDTIQKDLQFYHKHNATAFNTEACNNWAPRGLNYYLGAQLLWDVNADTKSIIKDFYEKAFGPAAKAMEQYYVLWYGPSVSVLHHDAPTAQNGQELKIGLNEFADYNPKSSLASKATLATAFKYLNEAASLVKGQPKYQDRVDEIRMYAYYLLLRNKVWEAGSSKNKDSILTAIKNETTYGARLTNTNMIHTKPLLGKGFMRLFKDYEVYLKDVPESQQSEKGWRQPSEQAPTHNELEQMWKEGEKYLGI
jgi:hypothetical protein